MHAERPSLTAALVAAARALYTELPAPYRLAPDPYAASLVPGLFSIPLQAVALAARVPGLAPLIHHGAGALSLGLTHHVALRTRAIDDALRAALAAGATQVVVLGAGLDSRAQRLDALSGARVFEVDHPSSQRYKAERLAHAEGGSRGRPAPDRCVRVPVDFERDRLDEALLAAGLDTAATARTFWIWEGVTIYLTAAAVAATLAAVSTLSAPGSRIAVTYTRERMSLSSAVASTGKPAPAAVDPLARFLAKAVGEPVRGMMETDAMFAALARAGFTRVSDESAADWAARFWPGQRLRGREWERLAVAERGA